MQIQTGLFSNEEETLQNATAILQQYYEKDSDVPIQLYEQLIRDYKKLLKQTKILVKMSDKQQNRLSEAEANKIRLLQEQEIKNVELIKLNQEKNEFLGIVAHDLKNPLSAILGMAEMLQESAELITIKEIIECSNIVQRSAQMMFQLITNLLDVNSIESNGINLHLEKTDLLPILSDVVNNYKERAKTKNITLIFQLDTNKYFAIIDQNIIQQVLDNLISNAIKYSPYNKQVRIRIFNTNACIRCEIEDEGMGLSLSDQQKLFGKFTRLTTKPTGGEHSTGLGLFIVKKLVNMMQGKVWCESELGKGANFIIELPSG